MKKISFEINEKSQAYLYEVLMDIIGKALPEKFIENLCIEEVQK